MTISKTKTDKNINVDKAFISGLTIFRVIEYIAIGNVCVVPPTN